MRALIFILTLALLTPAAIVTGGPRQGGILQLAYWAPPRSLDYCRGGNAFGAEAWVPIYEGLLSFDYKPGEDFRREMRVVPYLAERWEQPDPEPKCAWPDDFTRRGIDQGIQVLGER